MAQVANKQSQTKVIEFPEFSDTPTRAHARGRHGLLLVLVQAQLGEVLQNETANFPSFPMSEYEFDVRFTPNEGIQKRANHGHFLVPASSLATIAPMEILGIDFTSRPARRKPITCLRCQLDSGILTAYTLSEWSGFEEFEAALSRPGPWIAGLDFPFGQARRFIETIGWPADWPAYVSYAKRLGRPGFRKALDDYRKPRSDGDKEHRRATDIAAGSISPQKLYGVPVALMFFEGAPRLIAAGVSIPHIRNGDPKRIVVETYPGVLARSSAAVATSKIHGANRRPINKRRGAICSPLCERARRKSSMASQSKLGTPYAMIPAGIISKRCSAPYRQPGPGGIGRWGMELRRLSTPLKAGSLIRSSGP